MYLPKIKIRGAQEFQLMNDFHSKLDAERELKKIRNDNACFGRKKSFLFTSHNPEITFSHGVYEAVFYVKPVKQD